MNLHIKFEVNRAKNTVVSDFCTFLGHKKSYSNPTGTLEHEISKNCIFYFLEP